MAVAGVVRRTRSADESPTLEPLEEPAQVAGVEPELGGDLGRGGRGAVGELEQHAPFGEGEGGVEVSLVEYADEAGVEPVEPPHIGDVPVREWASRSGSGGHHGMRGG